MGYTKSVIKGISWISAFRVFSRIFSFVKIAVLARVLLPSQFGVFGVALLALGFLELLTETGINVILVQSRKSIEEHVDSAWIVSMLRGIFLASLLFLSAPFIASFFHTQDSVGVLRFIALVPFVRGFINPSIISFQKELQFHKEFWYRTTVFFFDSLTTIIVALITHSVYSLAWGLLAGACLEVLISFLFARPFPRFRFERQYANELFHKGKWVTGFSIFNYLAQEGDTVVVGRVLGATTLGMYEMGYRISIVPVSEVSDVVSRVVFPIFAKIGDDRKRLWTAFVKSMVIVLLISIAVGLILFLFPKPLVMLMLGEKWLSIVPVLQVLSFYGVFRTIGGPSSALFLAMHKQQYVAGMTFVRFFILLVTIYPLVIWYGMVGAAFSALLSVLVEIPLIVYYIAILFKKK